MPNNTIHGIVDDKRGNMWISTNNGLVRLNKKTNEIRTFYERDGLQGNEFSDGAYYFLSSTKELVFGGTHGYNIINPDSITQNNFMPLYHIDNIKLFNTPISPQKLNYKNGEPILTLNHNENFISLNFGVLDYINNENCEYAYQLIGFDKNWVNCGNNNVWSFSNIPHGKYKLMVKYTNNDKIWSEPIKTMEIIIRPPWWATWWAYALYALICIIIMFCVYKYIRNLSIRKQNKIILQLEKQEQERIQEAKLQFFTNIAHEFCTPISLIYGPCEQLMGLPHIDQSVKKYLRIIRANTDRMRKLIDELMDFRKASTGHTELKLTSVNLMELMRCIVDNFTGIIEENRINFELSCPEQQWISDRDCMEKIIFNLLSNAFKYTPQYGSISLHCNIENEKLIIEVTNSGVGLNAEELVGIFDRFTILETDKLNIKSVRQNGIGLALCKSLTTLLGGQIDVNSEINEYVRFTVTLPLLQQSDTVNETEEEIRDSIISNYKPTISTVLGKNHYNILIVDDEPEIRNFICDVIKSETIHILQASNGIEALELLTHQHVDLIITDLFMPQMDGLTFARELKENIFTKHLPIIFLSAKSDEEYKIMTTQIGSEIYITKPFHPIRLKAAVDSVLKRQEDIKRILSPKPNNNVTPVNKNQEFLSNVIKIIETRIEDESLDPNTICDELNISKITLYRRIKDIANKTPSELIRSIRLQQAGKLLLQTDLNVKEIMYRCGFNNKSYFHREFMALYNLSPKEYRNNHKFTPEEQPS